MRSERVQNDLGATAGLRFRNGQPTTSVTERVSGGGEPHPESPGEGSAVTLTRRKSHIGRDRSPAGTEGLEVVASTAQSATILGRCRTRIANKYNGSRFRKRVGRPRVAEEIERSVVRRAYGHP